MHRSAMAIIEQVEKRRTTTKEFPPEVDYFLRGVIDKLENDGRRVNPQSLQDASCLYGQADLGVDNFVFDIYTYVGKRRDYAAYLTSIGYEWDECVVEEEESEDEPEEDMRQVPEDPA